MARYQRLRITMADVLWLVLAAGAGSALFARLLLLLKPKGFGSDWDLHIAAVLVLAITLTCAAYGAWRGLAFARTMLCIAASHAQFLALVLAVEWVKGAPPRARLLLYWLQGCFALTVLAPALVLRLVVADMEPGPRRDLMRQVCEALLGSYASMLLVLVGGALQLLGAELLGVLI